MRLSTLNRHPFKMKSCVQKEFPIWCERTICSSWWEAMKKLFPLFSASPFTLTHTHTLCVWTRVETHNFLQCSHIMWGILFGISSHHSSLHRIDETWHANAKKREKLYILCKNPRDFMWMKQKKKKMKWKIPHFIALHPMEQCILIALFALLLFKNAWISIQGHGLPNPLSAIILI